MGATKTQTKIMSHSFKEIKNMIRQEYIETTLSTIFLSRAFEAETDRKLLRFLVTASIQGRKIREIDIAKEVFDRDESFNSLDSSIVRTHMHSVRKKLETYYLSDGVNDKIRFEIPKGGYKVEFVDKTADKPSINSVPYLLALIVLAAAASFFFWERGNSLEKQVQSIRSFEVSSSIWSGFVNSKSPTLLVIGDYYFYQKVMHGSAGHVFVRNDMVNSNREFSNYLKDNHEESGRIIKSSLTYLGTDAPYVASTLTEIFIGHEDKMQIRFASDLTWADIQNDNIIFVGSVKTLRKMGLLLERFPIRLHLFPDEISYPASSGRGRDTIRVADYYGNKFHYDFPIVAKFSTSGGRKILIIASFSSFGDIEALRQLTSPRFMKGITTRQFSAAHPPSHFEMLLEVYGVERNGFARKVLYFTRINSSILVGNERNQYLRE